MAVRWAVMAEFTGHLAGPDQDEVEADEPIHPNILNWLAVYARVTDADRDAIVARILESYNKTLLKFESKTIRWPVSTEACSRDIVEHMPGVLWLTDDELPVTSVMGPNSAPGSSETVASLVESLLARPVIGQPEQVPLAAHNRALRGESAVCEYQWHGQTYSIHLEPQRGPNGEISGVIGMLV